MRDTRSRAGERPRPEGEEGEEFGPALHEALAGTRVHAVEGAAVARGSAAWPSVLLSPGSGEYRAGLTAVAEELASRGYVVAGVDHPGDAAAVEFPDGRVVPHHGPEDGGRTMPPPAWRPLPRHPRRRPPPRPGPPLVRPGPRHVQTACWQLKVSL
ncbi:hypothetical protein [Streptomyces sp. PU-14G]|uniref:alpha/beta hydrolase n=1 Tax=Streptomyces sp. PU-14G TaxID=2800808 RepID=UPI0034E027E2